MKTLVIPAALLALMGSAAVASAQTPRLYNQVDCMQRDGGPTGCSRGQQSNSPQYGFYNGRFATRDRMYRDRQPDANAYYSPRDFDVPAR